MRIRGHAHPNWLSQSEPATLNVSANGQKLGNLPLDRAGLLIFEADLPDAGEYKIEVRASPTWTAPPDDPVFTVSLSRLRLVPRE